MSIFVKPSPGIAFPLASPRNDVEVTDPGIDVYISPSAEEPSQPQIAEQAWAPIRWVQTLLAKKRVSEEAGEIIAKIGELQNAPDSAIHYFFDNDLPRLVTLSNLQPIVVQQMLRTGLDQSPNRNETENWFRLVQIACGDTTAILPALDHLG